jgi:hypothetical protein
MIEAAYGTSLQKVEVPAYFSCFHQESIFCYHLFLQAFSQSQLCFMPNRQVMAYMLE